MFIVEYPWKHFHLTVNMHMTNWISYNFVKAEVTCLLKTCLSKLLLSLSEMDSEDEHDHDHDGHHPDVTSSQSSVSLTGFLFGNIDEKGELEDDILDEVSMSLIKYSHINIYIHIWCIKCYRGICFLGFQKTYWWPQCVGNGKPCSRDYNRSWQR